MKNSILQRYFLIHLLNFFIGYLVCTNSFAQSYKEIPKNTLSQAKIIDHIMDKTKNAESFENYLENLNLTIEAKQKLIDFLHGKGVLLAKLPKVKKADLKKNIDSKLLVYEKTDFDTFVQKSQLKTLEEKSALAIMAFIAQACLKSRLSCL
jgi:hypothetical protein